jgi:hypothetical protein
MKSFCVKMLVTTAFSSVHIHATEEIDVSAGVLSCTTQEKESRQDDVDVKKPLYTQESQAADLSETDRTNAYFSECDMPLDQETIDLGQLKSDELDPFALANAIIKDRIEKNESLLAFLRNESISPKERLIYCAQTVGSHKNFAKSIEQAKDSDLISNIVPICNAICTDIDIYKIIKIYFICIENEKAVDKKNELKKKIYCYLSMKHKKCAFEENTFGVARNNDFREIFFYKIIMDTMHKAESKPDDLFIKYTNFFVYNLANRDIRYRFYSELMINDLLEKSKSDWFPLQKNPFLDTKSKSNVVNEKITDIRKRQQDIFKKRSIILQRLHPDTLPKSVSVTPFIALLDDESELKWAQMDMLYYTILNPILIEIMKDWEQTSTEIKTLTQELNQWLLENKNRVTSQMPPKEHQAIYDFINPKVSVPSVVAAITSTTQSSKTHKKKTIKIAEQSAKIAEKTVEHVTTENAAAAVETELDAYESPTILGLSSIPMTKASLAAPQAVVMHSKLPPVLEQRVRTEPKIKTKGPRAEEDQALPQSVEENASTDLLFSKATDYPDWVHEFITSKHLKIRQGIRGFLNFITDYNLRGGYQQEGDKYVFSLMSPIDGVVYAETFHNPHKNIGEKSWPSWRYALYNLLVKSHIIDGIIR